MLRQHVNKQELI